MRLFKRLIYLCLILSAASAQVGKYTRKSISYIDIVLYSKSKLKNKIDSDYLLSAIHQDIRIKRFDYNPLPQSVQMTFKSSVQERKSVSSSEVGELMESTVVPELIKILDLQKEMRAKNLVTETQKNSFITLKAKEIGITAAQLEQVMNSAYLYIPYITNYTVKTEKDDDDDDKEVNVRISGGLIWYHLKAGDLPSVERIGKVSSEGWGSDDTESSAFRNASHALGMNLQVKTREMDVFKLQSPIASVAKGNVYFPLGKSEGIRMDQPFFIGEWVEDRKGTIKLSTSGFVRVGTVVDNQRTPGQLSTAWAVKKGDWARGMMIVEHPRLGIDIAVKPRWFNMTVKEGVFASEDFLIYFDDYKGIAIGMDADLQWNIAHFTKKRQTFLIIGGSAGVVPVRSRVYDNFAEVLFGLPTENWFSGVLSGYAGYMKKYYLGPFALHGEALLGFQRLAINDRYKGETINIFNNSIGARLNLGLEYAVNIDCNVGFFAGLTLFPPIDWWSAEYDDEEVELTNYALWTGDEPKIYSIGPTFGLYIHYSPPTIPFNPWAMIQSQLQKAIP